MKKTLLDYPDLVKEFHPIKNDDLKPENVSYGSGKLIWWICSKQKHEFQHSPNARTSKNIICPYCSGHRVGDDNNLEFLFPKISKEWDFEKNFPHTPNKVTAFSHKKYWFKCKLNHSYETRISYRTSKGSGCPKCTSSASKSEMRIFSELKHIFSNAIHRHKIKKVEFDIYISPLKLGIEFDGEYWHKNKLKLDEKKNKFCEKNNINLIRIREEPLNKISKNDILIPQRRDGLLKKDLNNIINQIRKIILFEIYPIDTFRNYLIETKFLNEEHFEEYSKQFPIPTLEKSFLKTHPQYEKFWDYEKNYPLRPEHFTYGSNRNVWWKCKKNHSYKRVITRKSISKEGCPTCNMDRLKEGKVKVDETNSLSSQFPEIAKEWHPIKNETSLPSQFRKFSSKKVWWQCKNNNKHEWDSRISGRTFKNYGCPICYKETKINPMQLIDETNSLSSQFPDIAKEWHPVRNDNKLPSQFRKFSGKKVWWQCNNNNRHEWHACVSDRTFKRSGCPICYKEKNRKLSTKTNDIRQMELRI